MTHFNAQDEFDDDGAPQFTTPVCVPGFHLDDDGQHCIPDAPTEPEPETEPKPAAPEVPVTDRIFGFVKNVVSLLNDGGGNGLNPDTPLFCAFAFALPGSICNPNTVNGADNGALTLAGTQKPGPTIGGGPAPLSFVSASTAPAGLFDFFDDEPDNTGDAAKAAKDLQQFQGFLVVAGLVVAGVVYAAFK